MYWLWASGEVQPWAKINDVDNADSVDKEKNDGQVNMKGYVNEAVKSDD